MTALADHPFAERFLARTAPNDDGCWVWIGQRGDRYGRFYAGDPSERWAHRIAWIMENGPIPDALEIDHLCRNTWCVNPVHLEPVTPAENKRRAHEARTVSPCGTSASYCRGCRCDRCRVADRTRTKARNAERLTAGQIPHGKATSYQAGCRCAECRAAATEARRVDRRAKGVTPRPEMQHGTTSMYTKAKCRCDACRSNWSEYWKAHPAAKRKAVAS